MSSFGKKLKLYLQLVPVGKCVGEAKVSVVVAVEELEVAVPVRSAVLLLHQLQRLAGSEYHLTN